MELHYLIAKSKNIYLCGGSSILPILSILKKKKTNLKKNYFLIDERIAKNVNLTNENTIRKNFSREIRLHHITDKKTLNTRPDITFIGFGEDGHFASIFLKSKKFKNLIDIKKKSEIINTEKIGNPRLKRITLNCSKILTSKKIIILFSNRKKMQLYLKHKMKNNINKFPILLIEKSFKKNLYFFYKNKLNSNFVN